MNDDRQCTNKEISWLGEVKSSSELTICSERHVHGDDCHRQYLRSTLPSHSCGHHIGSHDDEQRFIEEVHRCDD